MITSAANPQVKLLRQLFSKAKLRREEDVFLAEGPKMVSEAPEDRIRSVYCSESFSRDPRNRAFLRRLRPETIADSLFRSISDTAAPQGILAVVRRSVYTAEGMAASGRPLVILESLQDPGNLGTILRSGEGAGIGGVLMTGATADIYSPKTVRSTMGSIFRVPHCTLQDPGEAVRLLRDAGYRIFAAHLDGSVLYTDADYTHPSAFLIGNEGSGLTPETAALADQAVRIPMEGRVESLNAAIAATLLIYEAHRQKTEGIRRESEES